MKAVEFDEQSHKIAEDQPEYETLPALIDVEQGVVISCWQLSEAELQEINKTGLIWVSQMNFNEPLQPISITVFKGDAIVYKGGKLDEEKFEVGQKYKVLKDYKDAACPSENSIIEIIEIGKTSENRKLIRYKMIEGNEALSGKSYFLENSILANELFLCLD